MNVRQRSTSNDRGVDVVDPYSRLAACLWYLSQDDLADLLETAESLAIERFASRWGPTPGRSEHAVS